MINSLLASLDTGKDYVIEAQKELTSRPALGPENGGVGEEKKAKWVIEELVKIGFKDIRQFPCPDERVPSGFRPNIAAILPGKRDQTLWIVPHLDVVPPGEKKLWDTPPYEATVDGDFIFGRGVEDNQQAIVSALLVAKALISAYVTPDMSLGILLVADEETGMKHGISYVLDHEECPIGKNDLILVPDIGNSDGTMVETAEKSGLWIKFTITGKQCHASTPEKGINSLIVASDCILALDKLHAAFPQKNPLFSPPYSTFVPSKKLANVENINTVPGEDSFYLDCRVLPDCDLQQVIDECHAIVKEVTSRYGASYTIVVDQYSQSTGVTDESAPIVQRLQKSLISLRQRKGVPCGTGGRTVASHFRKKGIDAAVWSTLVPNQHAPNERSSISATIEDAKVMLTMLFD